MTPNEAEMRENSQKLKAIYNKKYSSLKKEKNRFYLGQIVRIAKYRDKMTRGYKNQFSTELYKIIEILDNLPTIRYRLKDISRDEEITGNFFSNEITPAGDSDT